MKKTQSEAKTLLPPDIASMYKYLFITVDMWRDNQSLTTAYRYSVIINAYCILDAVIHSYVVFNSFETSENEDNYSVYAKWKKFPYAVEKVSFRKKDIIIIDELRALRNQIAHPKAVSNPLSEKSGGDVSLEARSVDNKEKLGYLNLNVSGFKIINAVFLVNEITRLLILADKMLANTQFIPSQKLRFSNGQGNGFAGEMWDKGVSVI